MVQTSPPTAFVYTLLNMVPIKEMQRFGLLGVGEMLLKLGAQLVCSRRTRTVVFICFLFFSLDHLCSEQIDCMHFVMVIYFLNTFYFIAFMTIFI